MMKQRQKGRKRLNKEGQEEETGRAEKREEVQEGKKAGLWVSQ